MNARRWSRSRQNKKLTCLHCLQHSFIEHPFNLYVVTLFTTFFRWTFFSIYICLHVHCLQHYFFEHIFNLYMSTSLTTFFFWTPLQFIIANRTPGRAIGVTIDTVTPGITPNKPCLALSEEYVLIKTAWYRRRR